MVLSLQTEFLFFEVAVVDSYLCKDFLSDHFCYLEDPKNKLFQKFSQVF